MRFRDYNVAWFHFLGVASMSSPNNTVAIIGAGIVGLCVARSLQEAGYQVTIFDPEEPGSQCSFGNAGALSEGSVAPLAMPGVIKQALGMVLDSSGPLHLPIDYAFTAMPWLLRFVAASKPARVRQIAASLHRLLAGSVANHLALAQQAGCADLIQNTGQLHLYPSKEARDKDNASWRLKASLGQVMHAVDSAAIREMEPAVSHDYQYGWFLPDDAWVSDPFLYAQALARDNSQRGIAFVKAGIQNMQRQDAGWRLSDGSQSWQASRLVICAGIGSRGLLRQLGVSVPLESQRGYHIQFPRPGVQLSRVVVLADRKVFMNPMQGALRVAGTVEFGGTGKPMNQRRALLLKTHAQAGLGNLDGDDYSVWMGHRPCLPDSLPVIGPVVNHPDLWCAFGHGHLGLTGSVNTGILLARAMTGQAAPQALADFSPSRFQRRSSTIRSS